MVLDYTLSKNVKILLRALRGQAGITSKRLTELFSDGGLLEAMGRAGLENVAKEFSPKGHMDDLLEIYRRGGKT